MAVPVLDLPPRPRLRLQSRPVLELYARRFNGRRLRDDEYVISADEKSQLQALRRRHPDLPPGPGQPRRPEFEYQRGGTLAYFAALDVHLGQVLGRCAPKTGIAPFSELVEQVMTTEPYASAHRVYWVVDNGSSHNGARSAWIHRCSWCSRHVVGARCPARQGEWDLLKVPVLRAEGHLAGASLSRVHAGFRRPELGVVRGVGAGAEVGRTRARFSVTARQDPSVRRTIEQIPDDAWTAIHYPNAVWDEAEQRLISDAEVAESATPPSPPGARLSTSPAG